MIQIQEIVPMKLSGLTSLLITFDYKEEIVEKIKTLPLYYYHKKLLSWEVPTNLLAQVLDTLTFLDNIVLKLNTDVKDLENNLDKYSNDSEVETNLTADEINQFKFKPFAHQIIGINYLIDKKKALLLDEMGGGKTNQMIWTAETLKRRKKIDHCLVIVGVNSIKLQWEAEIKKYSTEDAVVIGKKITRTGSVRYKTIAERAEQLREPISEFFVIINVESLREQKIIDAINKSKNKFDMIIFDELHRCNNKSSSQGHNLLKLSAEYLIGASGTLLVNNPVNLYLPLNWIGIDHATLTNFKEQYCNFGGFNNAQIVGYKNLDLLKEELDLISIRRKKEEMVDLPPKTIKVETIEMSDAHQKLYEAVKNGVKEEVDKIQLTTGNLLALTTRLRQATACPEILTSQPIISSKVERCVELVEDLMKQGEKVVIMSTYKSPVYQLDKLLAEYKPLICTGDQDNAVVNNNVEKFQNDPEAKILIGTTAKCATGLNMNAAAYMICIDCAWTSAMNNQCFDRIYRINNTRPAFITILQCANTIDERVWEVAQYKQELSDYVIDDMENTISDSLKDEMKNIILSL